MATNTRLTECLCVLVAGVYEHIFLEMYIHIYICRVCVYIYIYIFVYKYVYMYIYIYISINEHVNGHMHEVAYIHTFRHVFCTYRPPVAELPEKCSHNPRMGPH